MNLLLDTHILLWSLSEDERLTPELRQILTAPENEVWVSAVSVWEIVIKAGRGKLQVPTDWIEGVKAQDFKLTPFESHHALAVSHLPTYHADPFDRALLAQAACEKLRLVTCDAGMGRYRAEVELLEL